MANKYSMNNYIVYQTVFSLVFNIIFEMTIMYWQQDFGWNSNKSS